MRRIPVWTRHAAPRAQRRPQATHGRAIVVVGVGRVGSVLGTALQRAGHSVAGWHPVDDTVRADLPLRTSFRTATRRDVRRADVLLLCVPDDRLAAVAAGLADRGLVRPEQVVVHTSGRHGVGVLSAVTGMGAVPAAVHPAMTFTGAPTDLERLAGTRFAVTAADGALDLARRLVTDLGGQVSEVDEEARPLYHAALAHGANHVVTLLNDAMELLAEAGVADPAAVLGPLVRAAVDNSFDSGDAALTGPVSRGDAGTVAEHLRRIMAASPTIAPTYAELARRTTARATASGRLDVSQAAPVLDVIAGRRRPVGVEGGRAR